ncbi:MAG: serine/threonine protein kinase, partial [Deltaproteobacteria bacterium]|nr:serine/threonine protein kinase [Deltaproteobacteria bacterium]
MIGDQIGNYRITGKLGEGGMGAVFLAEHVLLGRQAAIKVLLREMSHRQELVTRFFNEARAATAVKHPGIVEIYDFGYHTDGSAYIVMEFLEGETLSARLRRAGVLAEHRAAALGRQVASALAAAHGKGIVHRDLKPDNIFVVRDPDTAEGERTKILDFGIAKLAPSDQPGAVATRTGMVMGTPMYMSPEQCKGAGQVDHRADLYALGCILFEMVCGRHVFLAEGSGEVMAHHIFTPPPPPSSIRPVSPQLEQIILRALAKDPAHRFQSADELIAALHVAVPSGAYPSPLEVRPSWSGPAVQPMLTPQPVTPAPVMHAVTPAPMLSPPMGATALIATPMQQTTLSEAISSGVTVPATRRRPWLVAAVAIGTIGAVAGVIAISSGGSSESGVASGAGSASAVAA